MTPRSPGGPTKPGRARAAAPRRARRPVPTILVLRAAGTNCDRETAHAFEQAGATCVTEHVNAVLARPRRLLDVHGVVIPGGFSHGDDLGAGTVLGTRLRTALAGAFRRLVDRGGIVLGICNGFQVLVKTGLVPGFSGRLERSVTLAQNLSARYEDRWVTLEATTDRSVFLRAGERYRVPVAHAEGRVVPRDEATRQRLHADGQVALRYVGPAGHPAPYPFNPNGAVDDIAGITDPTGRILGLMPHPERHQFPWQSPEFHRRLDARRPASGPSAEAPAVVPDGLRMFQHAVEHLLRVV